jgi:carbonic anhydrase
MGMFEYLNMFSDAQAPAAPVTPAATPAAAKTPTPAPILVAPSNPSPGTNTTNTNSTDLSQVEGTQILLEDWLKVSSPSIRSSLRYPEIVLPNNDRKSVNSTHNFFRWNSLFKVGKEGEDPLDELYFYFRLSKNFFYYTATKTDLNILGIIPIEFVQAITKEIKDERIVEGREKCFTLQMNDGQDYVICGKDIPTINKFLCKIKAILLLPLDYFCNAGNKLEKLDTPPAEPIVRNITQPFIMIPLPSKVCNENWDYTSKGSNWECTCTEGKSQSPIDLPPLEQAIESPVKPLFQYEIVNPIAEESTIDGLVEKGKNIKIRYEKNALRIFHPNMGKIVTIDGAVYIAEEISFHTPAEHTINGEKFDLEMQVIHYGRSQGDIAKQVILSILFKRTPGVSNKFMETIDFFNLPNPTDTFRDITQSLYIPFVFYDADNDDIPFLRPFSFFTYSGSLSFPPCTERTIVYVNSSPIPLSSTVIDLFREALKVPDLQSETSVIVTDSSAKENSREIQNQNGRPIFYYNHMKYCGVDLKPQKPKEKGHYEKHTKEVTDYFYVTGDQPSGLPGALLVSEGEAKGTDLK